MKKTACLSLVCASLAAFAADTTVDTGNQMGVLKVTENETNYLLVAVPWNELGTGDEDVSIETLVNPDQLEAGDKLYVAAGNSYKVFKIENNQWVACATATVTDGGVSEDTGNKPSDTKVTRGNAVWLHRQHPSLASSFYLLGQKPEAGAVEVEVEVAAGNNLVASPAVGGLDLSQGITGAAAGDSITINGNDGTQKYFFYNGSTWKVQVKNERGVSSLVAVDATTGKIPAGVGFWYRAKTGGTLTF